MIFKRHSCSALIVFTVIYFSQLAKGGWLVFPRYSVFQVTSAVSVPVEIPNRKFFFDWGIQMNYDLPYNLSNFYSVPIWPGFNKRSIEKYSTSEISPNVHPSDFTAGEFYSSIEELSIKYGYHETCLLKSVCEIAHHPFADDHENLLTEILTFVLSPSQHDAFAEHEKLYKQTYEMAELMGFKGENCSKLYPECKDDFLKAITKIIFHN